MSQVRHFPVYVVRIPGTNEGCGHQHNTRDQAWHCAENIANARKSLKTIEVVKVSNRISGMRDEVVGKVEQSGQ